MAKKKKKSAKKVQKKAAKRMIKKPTVRKPVAKKKGITLPKAAPKAKGVDVGTKPISDARKRAEQAGLPRFKLGSGETAVVRFLIDDKTHFRSARRHTYIENQDGEIRNYTCNESHEDECFLCEHADDRPRTITMLPILNLTEGRLEVIEKGPRFAGQVVAYFNKYGTLMERDFDIMRQGSGVQDTLWTIIPNDPEELESESATLVEEGVQELFEKIDNALTPKPNEEIEKWYTGETEEYDGKKEKEEETSDDCCVCGAEIETAWKDVEFEDGTEGYECSKCEKLFDSNGDEIKDEEEKTSEESPEDTILCPDCENPIEVSALKCPHCGVEFEDDI